MTKLEEFLANRGPAEMYETYWVPCTLWNFAVSLAELASPGDKVLDDGFRKHLGEEFAPIHAWSFGGLDRLKELAEGAGFTINTLEKQVMSARFNSVEELMNVHITGGMRVIDGDVLMGIFDLADDSFTPKVEALLVDLRKHLGQYEGPSGLEVPWASDTDIATA